MGDMRAKWVRPKSTKEQKHGIMVRSSGIWGTGGSRSCSESKLSAAREWGAM